MRVLLDTHVLLFALSEPDRLSNTALEILQDASQELVVSSVSVFEIAWKSHRGTLPVPRDFVPASAGGSPTLAGYRSR